MLNDTTTSVETTRQRSAAATRNVSSAEEHLLTFPCRSTLGDDYQRWTGVTRVKSGAAECGFREPPGEPPERTPSGNPDQDEQRLGTRPQVANGAGRFRMPPRVSTDLRVRGWPTEGQPRYAFRASCSWGGAGDGRTGRPDSSKRVRPRPPAGVARRPRAGSQRAQGRVRAGAAGQG